jgi:hypothetical protein
VKSFLASLLAVIALAALCALVGVALAADDAVPNLALTPGVARTDLTKLQICSTAWGRDARHVTSAMRAQVFAAHGIKCGARCGQLYEVDHLISRELGGADDVKNLWPQPLNSKPWNARLKDKLENRLHNEVCAGRVMLGQAHGMLVNDWRIAYRKYYGEPK